MVIIRNSDVNQAIQFKSATGELLAIVGRTVKEDWKVIIARTSNNGLFTSQQKISLEDRVVYIFLFEISAFILFAILFE